MRKTIFVLFLTLALCLSACAGNPSTTPTTADNADNVDTPTSQLDIWQGISEDSQELTLAGRNATVLIRKDGSADLIQVRTDYRAAATYGDRFAEYDAEMATLSCYFGTYEIKGSNIIFVLDDKTYTRFDLRGADADAFKQAYIDYQKQENPENADRIVEAFGKGTTNSKTDGTQTMECKLNDKALTILTLKNHSKDGILTAESVMHDDGSYTNTIYFENGTVSEVREYTSDDTMMQKTVYTASGDVEYIEKKSTDDQGNSTTTRTDSNGNVIYLQESLKEKYDGGVRTIQRRTENGVVTYCTISDQKDSGLVIDTYDEITEDAVIHSVRVSGEDLGDEFSVYKVTRGGTLTEYQCQRYFTDGDVTYRQVRYNAEKDVFETETRYQDGAMNQSEIPAADYVHSTWEQYP